MSNHDAYQVRSKLQVGDKEYDYYRLNTLEEKGLGEISRLPFSIKVLLEAAIRKFDGQTITQSHVDQLIHWSKNENARQEMAFKPARIVLQDFTGVPAVVDLAAMRDAMKKLGGDPSLINPLVPVDLVIDHSVMVDAFGSHEALEYNMNREFERNKERYTFLHWAQNAFADFRVVPPATGIVHQVNLEYLANVAFTREVDGVTEVFPDSLVGTDSHTTMINGLGVVGWGVGGIEAEAGMLGQPLYFITPEVIGFKLTGQLAEGVTATDLALTVTEILRTKGVVNKIVEFYGPGLTHISLADRATVANMSPEYGATMGFFPVDEETLHYLRSTGRDEELINLVKAYYQVQGMFRTDETPDPAFSETISLDLGTVVSTLSGPKRPQDRISLSDMKESYAQTIRAPLDAGGYALDESKINHKVHILHPDEQVSKIGTGSVVIAAITSCTNTSNPSVMLGAGLLARKAIEKGLKKAPYVKSSLTPGSRVVGDYLEKSGLLNDLETLGFNIAGYGCATCIGNSGPLPDEVSEAIDEHDLTVAAVLSGNRNFEGRIHSQVKASYLASPPLVVAYALAGTVDIDLINEPLGHDQNDQPVFLKDIWPSSLEIEEVIQASLSPEMFREQYAQVFTGNDRWNQMETTGEQLYDWDQASTYIQLPPFFDELKPELEPIQNIKSARVLALLGDSMTTDHISPAGNIAMNSPAGKYLLEHGVEPKDFNSYGSRRGNHEVMMRGTLANIRIRNQVAPGTEGGVTKYIPTDEIMPIYDAAIKYQENAIPTVVFAGKEYGTGSSRDWAAKGFSLLGIKAVIAESFERIHRGNLVGMGVLPLQFIEGESWRTIGITGDDIIDVLGIDDQIQPGQVLKVRVTRSDSSCFEFDTIARIDSAIEVEYYRNGGILQTVLRRLAVQS